MRRVLPEVISILLEEGLGQFSMKCLISRDHADRTDSSILSLPARPSQMLLQRLATSLDPAIAGDAVPLFTHRYTGGIAIAHSPAGGGSFGQLRCSQIADAVLERFRTRSSKPLRLSLDSAAPWNYTASDSIEHFVSTCRRRRLSTTPTSSEAHLEILAARLHASALVADGKAAWLQRDPVSGRQITTGAGVYAGSAGALLVFGQAVRLGINTVTWKYCARPLEGCLLGRMSCRCTASTPVAVEQQPTRRSRGACPRRRTL